jgi:hypothetical protein
MPSETYKPPRPDLTTPPGSRPRNEARFSRQEDFGTSRIEAEPDNGLGESGLGEGQELLGRAEDDRLVAGETPETPDRAS